MDANFVKENMNMRWICETGIMENIEMLVKEYKQSRGLLVNATQSSSHHEFHHFLYSLCMDRTLLNAGIVLVIPALLLQPLRACILGPPASGKSTIVKQLCAHYKLHHIKIKDVIDEAMANLVREVRAIFLLFLLSHQQEGTEVHYTFLRRRRARLAQTPRRALKRRTTMVGRLRTRRRWRPSRRA